MGRGGGGRGGVTLPRVRTSGLHKGQAGAGRGLDYLGDGTQPHIQKGTRWKTIYFKRKITAAMSPLAKQVVLSNKKYA